MKFNGREWVNDLVMGAVTCSVGGAVIAYLVPGQSIIDATWAGGIGGLVTGMLIQPIKWLLERRPPEDRDEK